MKLNSTFLKQFTLGVFGALSFSAFAQTSDLDAMKKIDSLYTELDEIKIISSFAVGRKTPVAFSTVDNKTINEQLGSQELPEVLKMTPGVYSTKQGGGVGDARINVRGFDQQNIAVLINGVPVNDMEMVKFTGRIGQALEMPLSRFRCKEV